MTVTYQDVVTANRALAAWALVEASGLDFAPYIGGTHLTGTGVFDYQQAGPFAASFGLGAHLTAKLALAFVATVIAPVTNEVWIKLPSATPAAAQTVFYAGNGGANGSGVTVATNGHIHILEGGVADTDTGLLWPDAAWHLLQVSVSQLGAVSTLAIDGLVRFRRVLATSNAPVPNTTFYFGDSGFGSGNVCQIAMPAFYAYELTPTQMNASYLAATDPASAINLTITGGAGTPASSLALLNKLIEYVAKTFQNAP